MPRLVVMPTSPNCDALTRDVVITWPEITGAAAGGPGLKSVSRHDRRIAPLTPPSPGLAEVRRQYRVHIA